MIPVRFLADARDELAAAINYYDSESAGLGQQLGLEVRRLCDLVAKQPLAGSEVRPSIRRRLLRRFPYSLLYSVDDEGVLVIALAHQRRRPGYWRDRA